VTGDFHSRGHNFTNYIQKVTKYDPTTTLPEWLAEVTDLVNMASERDHFRSSIDRRTKIVWVFGDIVEVPTNQLTD
jgi:hypothetical protein